MFFSFTPDHTCFFQGTKHALSPNKETLGPGTERAFMHCILGTKSRTILVRPPLFDRRSRFRLDHRSICLHKRGKLIPGMIGRYHCEWRPLKKFLVQRSNMWFSSHLVWLCCCIMFFMLMPLVFRLIGYWLLLLLFCTLLSVLLFLLLN